LAALEAARPILTRLDASLDSEEVAADLIEGWSAVETALRSLVGGSALSGQTLIRELRTRHAITLEQANALAEFHAARERCQRTDYRPTEGDVDAARQGFLKLEAGLIAASLTAAYPTPSSLEAHPLGPPDAAGNPPEPLPGVPIPGATLRPWRQPTWFAIVLGLVLVAALGFFGYWAYGRTRRDTALTEAVDLYRAGQRERAQAAFERASRASPQDARPHIYLARMAREVGNLPLAQQQADSAIKLDPTSADAMREMGSIQLTKGDLNLASRFYTRAIERDSTDRAAMGWLGCVLMRQGRPDLAQRFLQRAGSGDWSTCAQAPVPGMTPQGAAPPQGAPPQGTYIPRSP